MFNAARTQKYFGLMAAGLGFVLLLVSWAFAGDVYRWTDDNGKIHYTDRPENVPEKYQKKTDAINIKPRQKISTPYSEEKPGSGKQHKNRTSQIQPVEERKEPETFIASLHRHGNSYFVATKFNGSTTARLLVDTGASLTIITRKFARSLGLGDLSDGPKIPVSTAGGRSWIRLVSFDSIEVSGAVAENVVVGVSSQLSTSINGLLGMTFLGEFVYQMDAPAGRLLLKPVGAGQKKYGGKSRSWWIRKYQFLVSEIRRYKKYEEKAKRGGGRSMSKDDYKKVRHFYEDLYSKLDSKASNHGVPGNWRQYP